MIYKLTLRQAKEILEKHGLESEIIGDENILFNRINSIRDARKNEAVILRPKAKNHKTQKLIEELNSKNVAAVITSPKLSKLVKNTPVLVTENPRLAFTYLVKPESEASIHETATIYDCVALGRNVSIGPHTIIGSIGLSINRHNEKLVNTAHIGGVIIRDNVQIGGNSVIVRAVMGNTIIDEYSILGHGISVGHGCLIGKRVKMAPGTVISGSCKVGDDVWIGPNASLRENISVGEGAFIGIGSVVIEDVPAHVVIAGNPAKILGGSKQPW